VRLYLSAGFCSRDLHTLFANYTHTRTHPHTCVYVFYRIDVCVTIAAAAAPSTQQSLHAHWRGTGAGAVSAASDYSARAYRLRARRTRVGRRTGGRRDRSGTVPSADDAASGRAGAHAVVVRAYTHTAYGSDRVRVPPQGGLATVDKIRLSGFRCICAVYRVQI